MAEMVLREELFCGPSVFVVEDTYQIVVPVKCPMLFWIEIDGKNYYDHSNGILRSSNLIHKVNVPMKELDRACKYTVNYRKIIERKPYFSTSEETVTLEYNFRPLKAGNDVHIYHISDSHGLVNEAVEAERRAENHTDLLILNGDIANDSGCVENICKMYEIASRITKGEYPCVYSRGNHDLRGACAEKLEDYTPTDNGLTYFTFKVGDIWGVILDCGEDKEDSHAEYGLTVCCHQFRQDETAFLEKLIEKGEYKSADVKHRLVICHVPFAYDDMSSGGIFNIENETYSRWCELLGQIEPELMLCGHVHLCKIIHKGDEYDNKNQPCTVILGGNPDSIEGGSGFTGASIVLKDKSASVSFNDSRGTKVFAEEVKYH